MTHGIYQLEDATVAVAASATAEAEMATPTRIRMRSISRSGMASRRRSSSRVASCFATSTRSYVPASLSSAAATSVHDELNGSNATAVLGRFSTDGQERGILSHLWYGAAPGSESRENGGGEAEERTEAVDRGRRWRRGRGPLGPGALGLEALLEVIQAILALVDGARRAPSGGAADGDGGRAGAPVCGAEEAPRVEQRGRLAVEESGGRADEVGGGGWRVDDDGSDWGRADGTRRKSWPTTLVAPTMATDGPSSRSAIRTVDDGRCTRPPAEDGSAGEEGGARRCDDRGSRQRREDGARRRQDMAHSRGGGRRTAALGRARTE
uniref:Uncharacterized protein n=1 Tax=Oryza nivara TaxID=4536 RepID=A0A0E0J308_ORYNI